jgi:hypothetical protein
MEMFFVVIFVVAALALLYTCVIAVWKGLSGWQAGMMVVAICILFSLGVLVYNITRDEDDLQYQENLADLMRSVESAILSGRGPAAATILHEQSGKFDDAPAGTWAWVKIYDNTMAALDKLNTKNAATKAAKDPAK